MAMTAVSTISGSEAPVNTWQWDVPPSIHEPYDLEYALPHGALGPDPDDHADMRRRLAQPWDPDGKVAVLRRHALRNLGPSAPKKDKIAEGAGQDVAAEIMKKVLDDGIGLNNVQPAEVATLNIIKDGMRDYIDYALDEVDRYTRVGKTGAITAFAWRQQANPSDVPCLRRSMGENGVTPDILSQLIQAEARIPSATSRQRSGANDKTLEWLRGELRSFKEDMLTKQRNYDPQSRTSVV